MPPRFSAIHSAISRKLPMVAERPTSLMVVGAWMTISSQTEPRGKSSM